MRVGRGLGGGKFGLGAEPGEGFVDAFLKGELGGTEDGISFAHWGDVVGDHAAVSGGGDIEGFAR